MVSRGEITAEMVERAIETYFRLAYDTKPRKKFGGDDDDVFGPFVNETRTTDDGKACLEKHSIQLGNRNYPYMKLVLQEHMVPGEFYFMVDTHDQMDIRPDFPDYEAWMKVRRFNLKLGKEIEKAFQEEGLPTLADVRKHVVLDPTRASRDGALIFVVDDEEEEAQALEGLLRRAGYDVVLAADGLEALERLRFIQPRLVILDYEMPELDGLAVIRELRRHEETARLRILLTTASDVISKERETADGFLPKPFRSGDLLELVERLLQ